MVIKLDKNQPKTIKMDINVQGIDKTKLNFHFKINLNEMTVGFIPRLVDDNSLEIYIPPLSSVLHNLDQGRYLACLEINDGEKYYLKPWEGELLIEEEPKITASIDEYEELNDSTVNVNYVSEEDKKKDNKKEKLNENKKPKSKKETKKTKMTKEQAVEFVQKARKKLVNEDKQTVDKFIKETLNKYGFDYKPEKEQKQSKSKNKKNVKIESRDDIIKFLKQNGIKNERTLTTLMETIDNRSGGDLDSMYDIANRMISPQQADFNDSGDVFKFFQEQQMSYSGQMQSGSTEDVQNNEEVDQSYTADTGSKSNLMEQIKKQKSDLNSQLNLNNK